MKYTIFIFVAQ